MPIYTFFTEVEDDIQIEQFRGADVEEAIRAWHKKSHTIPGPYNPDDIGPTPVAGVRNVWCTSGFDPARRFYLVHIIATLAK